MEISWATVLLYAMGKKMHVTYVYMENYFLYIIM